MSKYKRKEEIEDEATYSEEFQAQAAPAEEEAGNPEEASFKKRYGDLRRHTQQLMSQKDQEVEQLKAQLDKAAKGQLKFPKTDEEIEAWSSKYPEVAKIVDTIARKRANEALEEGEKRLSNLKNLETKLTRKEAEQQLHKLHPDFTSIRQDPAFHEWVQMQPMNMQDALYKNNTDAMAAARVIDLYKADMKKSSRKPSNSAAQAVGRTPSAAPAATGKAKYSESQVARMSDREYDLHEKEIMKAMQTKDGFIYDLSGGAR